MNSFVIAYESDHGLTAKMNIIARNEFSAVHVFKKIYSGCRILSVSHNVKQTPV